MLKSEQAMICEAAALMRQRANKARLGPYFLDPAPEEDGDYSDTGSLLAPSTPGEVAGGADEAYELGSIHPIATAQHLVHFSPTFALVLADWLERIAAGTGLNLTYHADEAQAVHLSRTYLGRTDA